MLGIVLHFNGRVKNIISLLLKNIDLTSKDIDLQYWESYDNNTCKLDFNDNKNISSEIIMNNLIKEDNEVYPEFVELFIREKTNPKKQISDYKSFTVSSYDLSMIIIDYRNIEICSKNENYLLQIIDNFENSDLENKRISRLEKINTKAVMNAWRSKEDINIYDSPNNR